MKKKYIVGFWLVILGGLGSAVLLFVLVANGAFGALPDTAHLENPKSNLATEVLSADGKVLGKYFRENRSSVGYEQISPHVINALISTEDERYLSHSGIDARGLARAIANMGRAGGASTITQQLAKMMFHERALSFTGRLKQKLQEWVIAVQLERRYTKNEILSMYLNKYDFVNHAVGIKSAATTYFGKQPIDLEIQEAAMLVGMLKNSSLFNPIRRPDTVLHRRNVVLGQLMRSDQITRAEFDSLRIIPLGLEYHAVSHKEGLAPYFREELRKEVTKLLREKDEDGEYVLSKPSGEKYNMYRDGLQIYTTIDSRLQKYAEYAVETHMGKEIQRDFWRDLKRRKTKGRAPFDWRISSEQAKGILKSAMRRTQRYRVLAGKECGNCGRRGKRNVGKEDIDGVEHYVCKNDDCHHQMKSVTKDSITKIFNTPKKMRVFSWKGDRDTTMTPMDSIKYYKSFLRAGMMSMDPHTGYIKAWVGGINYEHFRYDHVRLGKRQVGSTFKPFVYALAIQEGYSPCYEVPNIRVVFEKKKWGLDKDYSPKNSTPDYGGMMSLKYGMANSVNTVTAWVLKQFGPQAPKEVIKLAKKMGITSKLDPVPSLCLGVCDISVFDMVGANATFANKGVWNKPTFITRIEDKNGNVIKDFIPESVEALSEETAYCMLNLMKGVTAGVYNRHTGKRVGTGIRIRYKTKLRPYGGIKTPIAGKTGTTQNHSDGWFMGITRDLVTGVWVGGEDRSVRFSSLSKGQGANLALPIWAYYMQKAYADESLNISQEDFEAPEKLTIELDCESFYKNQNVGGLENGVEPEW